MVHLLPHWNLDVPEGTILPVLGYTSCDSAELFLNGKSYGRKAYSYPALRHDGALLDISIGIRSR